MELPLRNFLDRATPVSEVPHRGGSRPPNRYTPGVAQPGRCCWLPVIRGKPGRARFAHVDSERALMRTAATKNMVLGRTPSAKATTSLALLSLALVLLASQPGVEASRARRRHPIPDHADRNPSLASAGLTREDSSIPGVSIWTSKTAASAPERVGYARDALSRRKGGRGGGDGDVSRVGASLPASRSFSQAREWAGDTQVGRGEQMNISLWA